MSWNSRDLHVHSEVHGKAQHLKKHCRRTHSSKDARSPVDQHCWVVVRGEVSGKCRIKNQRVSGYIMNIDMLPATRSIPLSTFYSLKYTPWHGNLQQVEELQNAICATPAATKHLQRPVLKQEDSPRNVQKRFLLSPGLARPCPLNIMSTL